MLYRSFKEQRKRSYNYLIESFALGLAAMIADHYTGPA